MSLFKNIILGTLSAFFIVGIVAPSVVVQSGGFTITTMETVKVWFSFLALISAMFFALFLIGVVLVKRKYITTSVIGVSLTFVVGFSFSYNLTAGLMGLIYVSLVPGMLWLSDLLMAHLWLDDMTVGDSDSVGAGLLVRGGLWTIVVPIISVVLGIGATSVIFGVEGVFITGILAFLGLSLLGVVVLSNLKEDHSVFFLK